jgi:membrane-associated phospholipid phosphatase
MTRGALALAFGFGAFAAAQAEPSVPWTPSATGRHALEVLADEAGLDLPLTQWPLPRAAVVHALDALPATLPEGLEAARDRVRQELAAQQGSLLTVRAREHADALAGFGEDATPGSTALLRSGVLDGPWLAAQAGVRVDPMGDPARAGTTAHLDDTAVATEAFGLQLAAWAHRTWWGPGWQSALPVSNNAPALRGVSLQRADAATSASPWLSWLGPWNAEVFAARSEDAPLSGNPYLIGTRLTLRPFRNAEFGITRMSQWGGDGRPVTLHSLVDLMLGLHVNADTTAQQSSDPGNGLAGYDARLRCPSGLHCAVYTQWIGEDEAGHLPTKFLRMAGVELWAPDGADRFFFETARTDCLDQGHGIPGCAYRNYAYPNGYTNGGRWFAASAGPDSRLFTLGWVSSAYDSSVRLNWGYVGSRIGAFSPVVDDPRSSGRLIGVAARRSFAWGPATITPELDWNRVDTPDGMQTMTRVGLSMDVPLDSLTRGLPDRLGSALSSSTSTPATQALLGLALIGGSALLDRPVDDWVRRHPDDVAGKFVSDVGSALPLVGMAAAGVLALHDRGTDKGSVALASVESGFTAALAGEVLKYPVGRARPNTGLGPDTFGHDPRGDSSFPSVHTAVAWGVVTPFAQYYDAPWLYGAAALTNAARVYGREHWVSDTVAGALMGYWIGDAFYAHSDGGRRAGGPQVALLPHGVALSWLLK